MAQADAVSVPGPQRFRYAIEKFPEERVTEVPEKRNSVSPFLRFLRVC